MSNVSFITPTTSNLDIDVQAMNQAVKNMARLVVFRSTEYEVLRNKAVRATGYAKEVDDLVRQSIPHLTVALRGLAHFETLDEIGEALNNDSLTMDDQGALQQEYDNIAKEVGKEFTKTHEQFHAEATKLDSKMEDVRDILLTERVNDALGDERTLNTQVQQEISEKDAERAALQADRKTIIDAQDILRKYNVADMFKDYVPSTKDLEKVGVSDPKIEAVKQSVEIVKKILGHVGDGVRYIELADGRRAVEGKIDTVDTKLGALRTRLADMEPRLSDLNAILKVKDDREVVLAEAGKLLRTWKVFGDELLGDLDIGATQLNLQKPVNRQLSFLEHLAEQYRRSIVA